MNGNEWNENDNDNDNENELNGKCHDDANESKVCEADIQMRNETERQKEFLTDRISAKNDVDECDRVTDGWTHRQTDKAGKKRHKKGKEKT